MLVILSVNCAVNKTIDLGGDGTQDIMLNYLDTPDNSTLSLEFVTHTSIKLEQGQTVSAICISKQVNATDIQVGDKGFGLMFACYTPGGCADATTLFVWLYASFLSSIDPPRWSGGGNDFSAFNTGSLYPGTGTDYDTTYKLSVENATDLMIPLSTVDPEWMCFTNFLGNETTTRLDS
jgi:hypothetical protein